MFTKNVVTEHVLGSDGTAPAAFLKNGGLDGPRTLLPFAQIGNREFLIDGFAL